MDFGILCSGTFRVDNSAADFPIESVLRFLVQIVMQWCEEIGWCAGFFGPWGDYEYMTGTLQSVSAKLALSFGGGWQRCMKGCVAAVCLHPHARTLCVYSMSLPTAFCVSMCVFVLTLELLIGLKTKKENNYWNFMQCWMDPSTSPKWLHQRSKMSFSVPFPLARRESRSRTSTLLHGRGQAQAIITPVKSGVDQITCTRVRTISSSMSCQDRMLWRKLTVLKISNF